MLKSPIPVYAAEQKEGLEQVICANNMIAYVSPVVNIPAKLSAGLVTANVLQALGQADNFDLHPIQAILVSTGWNINDDVFDRKETWIARYTPEDKPFNQEHIPSKIIGHITGTAVVDDDLNLIGSSTPFEELPDNFHIVTSAVVYKHLRSRDKDLEAEAAKLIEGIQNGDWFVSMEALFGDFDYGLVTASGEQQIIQRNANTAFLTKHLRIYGGTGEYNGCHLGRVLKHITFSGKGLVRNPANPKSVILQDIKKFNGVLASSLEDKIPIESARGDENMSEELKKQVETLQAQLDTANRKLEELGAKQVQAAMAAKDGEITKLQATVTEKDGKIAELTAACDTLTKAKAEVETAKAEVDGKLAEASKQLDTIKAETIKTNRVSALVDKGVAKTEAETIVTDFSAATDEQFAKVIAMQAALVEARKQTPPAEKPQETTAAAGETPPAKPEENADPKGEQAAAGANIDGATPDPDPALAAADENKNAELMTAMASYFEQVLENGKRNK